MSTQDNKALARRLIEEAWNQGNLATVDELMAPGHVGHHSLVPNQSPSITTRHYQRSPCNWARSRLRWEQ